MRAKSFPDRANFIGKARFDHEFAAFDRQNSLRELPMIGQGPDVGALRHERKM